MYFCHYGTIKTTQQLENHTHTLRLPRPHSWLKNRSPFSYHLSQQETINVVKIKYLSSKAGIFLVRSYNKGIPLQVSIQFLHSLTPPSTDTWRTCLFSPCGSIIIDWLFVLVQRNYRAVAVSADRTTRAFYWSFLLANSTLSCLKRGHKVDAENKLQITNYKPKYSLEIREHLIRNMHFSS